MPHLVRGDRENDVVALPKRIAMVFEVVGLDLVFVLAFALIEGIGEPGQDTFLAPCGDDQQDGVAAAIEPHLNAIEAALKSASVGLGQSQDKK